MRTDWSIACKAQAQRNSGMENGAESQLSLPLRAAPAPLRAALGTATAELGRQHNPPAVGRDMTK